MRANLMYETEDLDLDQQLPFAAGDLVQDLELETLFMTMADGDEFVFEVVQEVVLSSLTSPQTIRYRQQILDDCLKHPDVIQEIYELTVEVRRRMRREILFYGRRDASPGLLLSQSLRMLELFVEVLRRLRDIGDQRGDEFRSPGMRRFFAMLCSELDDSYLATVESCAGALEFPYGELLSAELGKGNKGVGYRLHKAPKPRLAQRIFGGRSSFSFQLAERDENGARALGELRQRGIAQVAKALAQSTDHIERFFEVLRTELAFYVGAINLHRKLAGKQGTVCFPTPAEVGSPTLSARGLYDVSLRLKLDGPVVGNEVSAESKSLVMITGANQGGKSTFLRSVGQAQLMMQCGLFVAAESFAADVRQGLFTHFKREEDAELKSGKFDEELGRMSEIIDHISPGSVVLCNESFASTNEREGSEIASQILGALQEAGTKIFFVTHMFHLADDLFSQSNGADLFLRAERTAEGRRTFRVIGGRPLETSFGADLYQRIFAAAASDIDGAKRNGAGSDQSVSKRIDPTPRSPEPHRR